MSPEHEFYEPTSGLIKVLSATHRTAIQKGLIECWNYLSVWIEYMIVFPVVFQSWTVNIPVSVWMQQHLNYEQFFIRFYLIIFW